MPLERLPSVFSKALQGEAHLLGQPLYGLHVDVAMRLGKNSFVLSALHTKATHSAGHLGSKDRLFVLQSLFKVFTIFLTFG